MSTWNFDVEFQQKIRHILDVSAKTISRTHKRSSYLSSWRQDGQNQDISWYRSDEAGAWRKVISNTITFSSLDSKIAEKSNQIAFLTHFSYRNWSWLLSLRKSSQHHNLNEVPMLLNFKVKHEVSPFIVYDPIGFQMILTTSCLTNRDWMPSDLRAKLEERNKKHKSLSATRIVNENNFQRFSIQKRFDTPIQSLIKESLSPKRPTINLSKNELFDMFSETKSQNHSKAE